MRKTKVIVTQRIDNIDYEHDIEVRECLDTRLTGFLQCLHLFPVPISCSIQDLDVFIDFIRPDGLILSGGNSLGSCKKRDLFECRLLSLISRSQLPVLGICRGMQMINSYQGGALVNVENHVRTTHTLYGESIFNGLVVNSYHSMGIRKESLGKNLVCLANSPDGTVESLIHKSKPWLGIMWHPERNIQPADSDLDLVSNLFRYPHAIHRTCCRTGF